MIRCDYYDYLAAARGDGAASARRVDLYRGEYMLQFSWAEETNSVLSMMQENWGRGA